MQNLRGERFFIPLEDHVDAAEAIERKASTTASPFALVNDVLERPAAKAAPPAPPKAKTTPTGFPEHRKRTRQSLFKQSRNDVTDASYGIPAAPQLAAATSAGPQADARAFEQADRLRIDQENREKLSKMSSEEIEAEREELFSGLSPALIQRLLKRSTLDEQPTPAPPPANPSETGKPAPTKKVAFAEVEDKQETSKVPTTSSSSEEAAHPPVAVDEAAPPKPEDATTVLSRQLQTSHFPQAPSPPDLDPNSTTFLTDLHEKYFPNLSHDPAKLSWMLPLSASDTQQSPYHPSNLSIPAAALRFDFNGRLLPPRLAAQIPVSAGLHHHGAAPEAAGYTIPEIALLARSSNAAQRCIAFQTAGRILYRLGIGEFGREDDELAEIAALSKGLWDAVEEGRVVQVMAVEAARESGHVSARAYAQEALWNWRRGGGRKRRAQ